MPNSTEIYAVIWDMKHATNGWTFAPYFQYNLCAEYKGHTKNLN